MVPLYSRYHTCLLIKTHLYQSKTFYPQCTFIVNIKFYLFSVMLIFLYRDMRDLNQFLIMSWCNNSFDPFFVFKITNNLILIHWKIRNTLKKTSFQFCFFITFLKYFKNKQISKPMYPFIKNVDLILGTSFRIHRFQLMLSSHTG